MVGLPGVCAVDQQHRGVRQQHGVGEEATSGGLQGIAGRAGVAPDPGSRGRVDVEDLAALDSFLQENGLES